MTLYKYYYLIIIYILSILVMAPLSNRIAWFYKKADAIEFAKTRDTPILLAQDKYDKDGRSVQWFGIIEQAKLLNFYAKHNIENEHLYSARSDEIGDQITKLYIDIDLSRDEVTPEIWHALDNNYKLIPKLADAWMRHHVAKYWPNQQLPKPIIFASMNPDKSYNKISFHIHYPVCFPALFMMKKTLINYIEGNTDFVFPEWWPLGKTWQFTNIKNPDQTKYMMDPAPWGRGVFRLPGQSKLGKTAKLYQYVNPNKAIPTDIYMPLIWTHSFKGYDFPIFKLNDDISKQLNPIDIQATPIKIINEYREPIHKLDTETNAEYLLRIIPKGSQSRQTINNIFIAIKTECQKHDIALHYQMRDAVVRWSITDKHAEIHGFDECYKHMTMQYNRANGNISIGYVLAIARTYQPDVNITGKDQDITESLDDLYNSTNPFIKHIDMNHEYVQPIEWGNSSTLLIRSSMGSGKSTRIREWIQSLNIDISILFITNRRVLANELNAQYEHHGFIHYEKLKTGAKSNRIIIQLESLTKVAHQSFSIIILDECESLCCQLYAPTHKDKLTENSTIFAGFVKAADKVVMMDAFIGKRSFNLVRALRNVETTKYLRYLKNPRTRQLEIYKAQSSNLEPTMKQRLYHDVVAGKRLYVWSGYKAQIEQIYNHMLYLGVNADRILKITSDLSSKEKAQIFNNVNEQWARYDYVLATPIITVGCNFDRAHFDSAYVIHQTKSCCVRDAIQAMMRCRQLKTNIIHFQVEHIQSNDDDTCVTLNKHADVFNNTVGGWYSQLHTDMNTEQQLSQRYPFLTLLKLAHEGIFGIHVNNDEPDEDTAKLIRKLLRRGRKNVDPNDIVTNWVTGQFSYDEHNRIIEDDDVVGPAIDACENHCDDARDKDINDRHYFQQYTRNHPDWNIVDKDNKPINETELTELYQQYRSSGQYRDYLRSSNMMPRFGVVYDYRRRRPTFNPLIDDFKSFNKPVEYVIRVRESFISFFLKLEHKNIDMNKLMNDPANKTQYDEFTALVAPYATHYGVLPRRKAEAFQHINDHGIKPFQLVSCFNIIMSSMRAGLEITHRELKDWKGKRTQEYKLSNQWEHWTRSRHHIIAGEELPTMIREMRQFEMNTFKRVLKQITEYGEREDDDDIFLYNWLTHKSA